MSSENATARRSFPSLRPEAYAPIRKDSVLDPTQLCEICQKNLREMRVLVDVVSVSCELDVCKTCGKAAEINPSSTS